MQRELDHRTADNGRIEVSLDWDDASGELTLTLADAAGTRTATVPGPQALEAYRHPYAWLGTR